MRIKYLNEKTDCVNVVEVVDVYYKPITGRLYAVTTTGMLLSFYTNTRDVNETLNQIAKYGWADLTKETFTGFTKQA